ncbi:MAG TPA: Gfo/Idh/MocA family oxidoreductase [Longimicrobiales bacterium]|nr:Gfo/Idh/MocA family oxidoreductase [Longimicrobiales bacterium]
MSSFDRREFLKTGTIAGVGIALGSKDALAAMPRGGGAAASSAQEAALFSAPPLETVRVAFVGVGHQGSNHVANFLRIEGVEITAICDIAPEKVAAAQKLVTDAGRPLPAAYDGGPRHYLRLCESDDVDLVFTATPWRLHAPVCIAAMEAGKHAATEVPMAVTIDELWHMVETAERTQRHCVMMENCCYDRTEMMILNMVRQGLFGDLLHAECGYLHDLRELKLTDFYEGRWRIEHSISRNGDLYPTHGLGPVAQWMDVNRGNQFDYIVSMASPGGGLSRWAAEHIGPDSPEATQRYALGDVVNTLIRTTRGQTILLTHDTNTPRPYSRRILLQGTNGLVRKYPEQLIHIEGRSEPHRWDDLSAFREEFDHPVWQALEERSRGAGHGGMDFIEDYRLVQSLLRGEPMDMDVYDGAAWSAISELSERSIAQRSAPQDAPDFTRGAWRTRPPLGIVGG